MPRSITDIATRHQVMLERLKAGKAKDYLAIAKKFEADIINAANKLGVETMDQLTKKELNLLISNLTKLNKKYQAAIVKDLSKDLKKLAKDDAIFERDTLNSFLPQGVTATAADAAYSAAILAPVSATGELLEPFIDNWSKTRITQVNGAIRKGYKEGLTLNQMTQRIRGTKANNYRDGLTNLQTKQAQAVIRTSLQHVSSTARMATLERNKDIVKAYKWRSTLDGRTTQRCRSLDGLEFEMGKGPMPPIHIGCRSTINFVLDEKLGLEELDEGGTRASKTGPVPANQTYYDWLKTQPKSFQVDAIGKQRAEWLTDGKLNSEQFARLNLNKNFEPLTLEEMRKKRASMLQ
jgi:SPP1 gp7 family putative phage head morphogenesis protein